MINSANPMLNLLNQSQGGLLQLNNINKIKSMMNILKNSNNPYALLQQFIQQNPRAQQVMNYINQNGGDPKQAFYKMAQEKGLNPDEILKQLN